MNKKIKECIELLSSKLYIVSEDDNIITTVDLLISQLKSLPDKSIEYNFGSISTILNRDELIMMQPIVDDYRTISYDEEVNTYMKTVKTTLHDMKLSKKNDLTFPCIIPGTIRFCLLIKPEIDYILCKDIADILQHKMTHSVICSINNIFYSFKTNNDYNLLRYRLRKKFAATHKHIFDQIKIHTINEDIIYPTKFEIYDSGYIYLIQTASMKDDCFKLGKTSNKNKSRIKSYGSDRKEHYCIYVNQVGLCEKSLIKKFKKTFKPIQGKEYFQGDKQKIMELFISVLNTHVSEHGDINTVKPEDSISNDSDSDSD